MNNKCLNRRYARTIALAQKFESNTRMIEKTVWQDEKYFTPDNLQNELVYGTGKISDALDENFFMYTNKM